MEAVKQIDAGMAQLEFAIEYMKHQLAEIPAPAEDAPEAEVKAYANEKVKIDRQEAEYERQLAYRDFIRSKYRV